ncbi:MauE/DoxX family redox-associated membrane protein [Yeosuana aromativorans]|uniref:MauE/DoxX family redox-associated membrane protein n=1 Tax=Yeosuana aromativorans TaxID=288019 RepID=UPI0016674A1E|nr:MauE/DoxX family redox-associated membrane protein [Yeosuana aromativorans]
MKLRQYHRSLIEIICFLFIFLFSYAATSKLMDFDRFKIQIGLSPLLTVYAGWIAWVIPFVELLLALMLAIPRYRLAALYGSLGLMSFFTMYIIGILNFSDHVPCSCGGILESLGWQEHLVLNIVFWGLAVIGIMVTPPKQKSP